MKKTKILVINPGSTSIKMAVYESEDCVFSESADFERIDADESVKNSAEKKEAFIADQIALRIVRIEDTLKAAGIDPKSFDVIASRGGDLSGVGAETGAYEITPCFVDYMKNVPMPWHPNVYGTLVASRLAEACGCKAYIYDAPSVDEMIDVARVTGYPGVFRQGGGHVLNHRATAIRYAKSVGKPLKDLRLVVAHLGGGCTFMALENGRMADVCHDMEGNYSPERGGSLAPDLAMNYYASHHMIPGDIPSFFRGKTGIIALLGTTNMREVEKRVDKGDEKARLVFEGMIYRMAKAIGGLVAAPLKGNVDAIILTGGIARSQRVVEGIQEYIRPMARSIVVYPGESELEALAMGALRVYQGEEEAHDFAKVAPKRKPLF